MKDEKDSNKSEIVDYISLHSKIITLLLLLLFPGVGRPTKALPHPTMSRACNPTATTASGCVLSGSAMTPPS